nr:MAG TPA: portal protein [Caudoviricetes sp.]
MNFDYEKENIRLPLTLRKVLGVSNRVTKQNQFVFLRLFSNTEQRAILNNLNASEIATGFVPHIHYSNLMTGLAPNLVKILVRKIAGRVFIEGDDEETKQVKLQFSEAYLTKVLKKAFTYSIGTGRATLVVDWNAESKKVRIRDFDLYRSKLKYNEKEELIQADLFLNDFATEVMQAYIVIERRYYNQSQLPCQKIVVAKCIWDKEQDLKTTIIEYADKGQVPEQVRRQFANIQFYQEIELEGYTDLGVYPIDNTVTNGMYPYSNIPESQFLTIQDMLIENDITRTNKNVDQEFGRSRLLIPEFMSSAAPVQGANNNIISHLGSSYAMGYGQAKDPVMTRYPTRSMEESKPTAVQFDLRTEQWRADIGGVIGDICSAFGISVLDYDPRLLQMGQRTDDEINAMTDITRATVEDKREIAEESINSMLRLISSLYGLDKPLFLRWSMRTILNPTKNSNLISTQLANGTISLETAVRRENPDYTDAEIKEELERIKNDNKSNPPIGFEF